MREIFFLGGGGVKNDGWRPAARFITYEFEQLLCLLSFSFFVGFREGGGGLSPEGGGAYTFVLLRDSSQQQIFALHIVTFLFP